MIIVCLVVVIGMTFALFTDQQEISNHLRAGNMDIGLNRIGLEKTYLDESGYLVTKTYTVSEALMDFSDPANNGENVFDIIGSEKIVPGCHYEATMQIENKGDVAFRYWIEIRLSNLKTSSEELAKQLKVAVNTGEEKEALLNDGLTVKGADGYVGEISKSDKDEFTVSLEFLDSLDPENNIETNNNVQGTTLNFDLIVHAVQVPKTSAANP